MKFKLEDFIEGRDGYSGKKHDTLPSVADAYRKAYYSRPKLTLNAGTCFGVTHVIH